MHSLTKNTLRTLGLSLACLTLTHCATGPTVEQTDTTSLATESRDALATLYEENPQAKSLGTRAKGILVFPHISKGGFIVGGMGGNGALIKSDDSIEDFYQTGGLSYGLQAGVQKYSYALFLMDDEALKNINRDGGWEVGSSPSLVIVDQGKAATLSTKTIDSGTYAFFFSQKGLMGGLSLQGSKITRISP